jgi:hypothetical protein
MVARAGAELATPLTITVAPVPEDPPLFRVASSQLARAVAIKAKTKSAKRVLKGIFVIVFDFVEVKFLSCSWRNFF